jgi:hypothetical protein
MIFQNSFTVTWSQSPLQIESDSMAELRVSPVGRDFAALLEFIGGRRLIP